MQCSSSQRSERFRKAMRLWWGGGEGPRLRAKEGQRDNGAPALMDLAQPSTYQVALGCETRMYWTHTHCAAASRTDCPSGLVNKETGSPGRDTPNTPSTGVRNTQRKSQDKSKTMKGRMKGCKEIEHECKKRERSWRTDGRVKGCRDEVRATSCYFSAGDMWRTGPGSSYDMECIF